MMTKYINDNMYLYECKNTIPNNGGHGRPRNAKDKIQSQTNPHANGGGKSGIGSGSALQYFGFLSSLLFHQRYILIHSSFTDAA